MHLPDLRHSQGQPRAPLPNYMFLLTISSDHRISGEKASATMPIIGGKACPGEFPDISKGEVHQVMESKKCYQRQVVILTRVSSSGKELAEFSKEFILFVRLHDDILCTVFQGLENTGTSPLAGTSNNGQLGITRQFLDLGT